MRVSKDMFFSFMLVLLAITAAWADSGEKLITPIVTVSPLTFPNSQRSFFPLIAANENDDSKVNIELDDVVESTISAFVNFSRLKTCNFGVDVVA